MMPLSALSSVTIDTVTSRSDILLPTKCDRHFVAVSLEIFIAFSMQASTPTPLAVFPEFMALSLQVESDHGCHVISESP